MSKQLEVELDQESFDYMRVKLHDHEEFADMTEIDKAVTLNIVEYALTLYKEGCLLLIEKNNSGNDWWDRCRNVFDRKGFRNFSKNK